MNTEQVSFNEGKRKIDFRWDLMVVDNGPQLCACAHGMFVGGSLKRSMLYQSRKKVM